MKELESYKEDDYRYRDYELNETEYCSLLSSDESSLFLFLQAVAPAIAISDASTPI